MKARYLLIPGSLTLTMLVLLTALYPSTEDFDPSNPDWNGVERASRLFNAVTLKLSDASSLDSLSYTLLIVGPSRPFLMEDVRALRQFLAKGGRVVIADDFGTANQLLSELGVPVEILEGTVADPALNLGSQYLPLVLWGPKRVALNYASALNISSCTECRVLAFSSALSYLDVNMNGKHDAGEPEGPLPVAAALRWGAGELVVIADSSLFINSMLTRQQNLETLREILNGTRIALVIDTGNETILTKAKSTLRILYELLQSPEIKYSLAVILLLGSFESGRRLRK